MEFQLRRAEESLAVLRSTQTDFPWLIRESDPTVSYATGQPLFEEELSLLDGRYGGGANALTICNSSSANEAAIHYFELNLIQLLVLLRNGAAEDVFIVTGPQH